METPTIRVTILTDRRRYSSVLDVRSFWAADCDTDHSLIVATDGEKLAVNRQRSHRFHMQMFNIKKLNEVQVKEKCHAETLKRFAALEDMDTEMEIN
jgi:hypothetical protein